MCAWRRPLGKGTQSRRQKEQDRGFVLSPADWETAGPKYSEELWDSAKHTIPETLPQRHLALLPNQRLRKRSSSCKRFDFRSNEKIKQQWQISASYNVLSPPCTPRKKQSTQGSLVSPGNHWRLQHNFPEITRHFHYFKQRTNWQR